MGLKIPVLYFVPLSAAVAHPQISPSPAYSWEVTNNLVNPKLFLGRNLLRSRGNPERRDRSSLFDPLLIPNGLCYAAYEVLQKV
jgi:hypothetical protein